MYALAQFKQNWSGNLFGGVTAAIVALPLALAFGISSGAGPVAGLYGAIMVGFFAAVFGGTASQISGPTGPMTVVVTAMTAQFIASDPEHGLALVFTCVFLGGLMQIAFGLLRLGKYIIMVPYPVISGFMTAIGVIIIILQVGPLLGFASQGSVLNSLRHIPEQISHFDIETLIIGITTLAVVFLWRGKLNRRLPSPLLALIVATAMLLLLFPNANVTRIGHIPSALPSIVWPTFSMQLLPTMLMNAMMLAVLGSIDSLLTSLVADNLTSTQHDSDRELIGQGIGNTLAGIVGGLPGAGATMRTVVNLRAGGTGPLAGATHALLLLGVVLGFGFLFENIPVAALAAVLIKVGVDIIDWPFLKRLNRLPKFPVFLMTLVFLLTVFVDLITAVFIGVFIKNLVTISKLSDLELGSVIISDGEHDLSRLPKKERKLLVEHIEHAVLLRITGPVSYAVARGLNKRFSSLKHRKYLLVDLSDAAIIGISTAMVLEDLVRKAQQENCRVLLIDPKNAGRQELQQLHLIELVGKDNCFSSVAQAFATIQVPH